MSTLSLGLRGVEGDALVHPGNARGTGLSVALHGAGITALVLMPLFDPVTSPDVAKSARQPLPNVVRVELPPAARPAVQAARGSRASSPQAPATAVVPAVAPSTETPTGFSVSDVLDPRSGATGLDPGTGTGIGSGTGGDCALGALCGAGGLPPAPTQPETVRIGGDIREPKLIAGRPPVYPDIARSAGLSAIVILEAHVSREGRILEVRILRGHDIFNESAVESVRSRRYESLLLNGVPTDFLTTITVNFTIKR